jgi:type IV secretion system protein VirB5
LQGALGGAGDARAVLDLGARIALEAAMSANDQMRVEGLLMTQASEEKLALQRERERAAAASAARLALYRSAFP